MVAWICYGVVERHGAGNEGNQVWRVSDHGGPSALRVSGPDELTPTRLTRLCLGGVGVGSGGRNQTETLSFSASPTPSHWPKDLAAIGGEESRVER